MTIKCGTGARISDGKGSEYLDFDLNGGRLILGHAHRNVVLGVKKCAERGIGFGTTSRDEENLRRELLRKFQNLQDLFFTVSEGEALLDAVALACRAVKRKKVIACCSRRVLSVFESLGMTHVTGVAVEDIETLQKIFADQPEHIAAVIVEPLILEKMRLVSAEYVHAVTELCRKHGALLISDERRSCYHSASGLVSREVGLKPEIVCLGGVLGGGFALGACGIAEGAVVPKDFYTGDPQISPVIFRAGLMTVKVLNDALFKTLDDRARELAEELNAACQESGGTARVSCFHHLLKLHFPGSGGQQYGELQEFLLARGIYISPDVDEPFSISLAHSRKDIKMLKETVGEYFKALRH